MSSTATPPSDDLGPYALLRNRNLVRYLVGRFIATAGHQMFTMALGWEIYERTHSAFALGLVGLTLILPMYALTLPAGHLADNHSRKRIVTLTVAIVAVMNLIFCLISLKQARIEFIYVSLVIVSSARTFMGAAMASFMPQLVERQHFSKAVTWNGGLFQLSSIVGPSLAGLIIGWAGHKAWPVYALNAGAALVFCALLSTVHIRQAAVVVKEKMTLASLLTGFRFVFSNRIVSGVITLDMFAVLLGGATALLPVFAKEILHTGPRELGFLQSALPLGAVVCSIYMAHRPPLQKAGPALLWAVVCFGLATIGFGLSHWFWLSFAMLFACGLADNVSVVVRHTLVQMLTPDEKRGRVSAVNNLFINTSNELGEFESGSVAHLLGPAIGNTIAVGAMLSVVTGGIGTIAVVGVIAWLWPEIRRYGRLDHF
jgi:MFS family permease